MHRRLTRHILIVPSLTQGIQGRPVTLILGHNTLLWSQPGLPEIECELASYPVDIRRVKGVVGLVHHTGVILACHRGIPRGGTVSHPLLPLNQIGNIRNVMDPVYHILECDVPGPGDIHRHAERHLGVDSSEAEGHADAFDCHAAITVIFCIKSYILLGGHHQKVGSENVSAGSECDCHSLQLALLTQVFKLSFHSLIIIGDCIKRELPLQTLGIAVIVIKESGYDAHRSPSIFRFFSCIADYLSVIPCRFVSTSDKIAFPVDQLTLLVKKQDIQSCHPVLRQHGQPGLGIHVGSVDHEVHGQVRKRHPVPPYRQSVLIIAGTSCTHQQQCRSQNNMMYVSFHVRAFIN